MSSSSSINHLSQPCIYGHFVSSYGERKSRFMKWLSKLFKSGSDRGGMGRRNPQYIGEENMVWRPPARSVGEHSRTDKEREELDRALALSLAEDLKRPPGYRWQTENDEDLRALQDVPNSSSYPPYANVPNSSSYPPYDPTDYYPRDYRVCGGCNRDIGCGNYLGCMGAFFHPECFRCHSCGFPITEHEFSSSGRHAYHKSCYKELTHPKCEVCHQFIPTNGAGLIEYRCHPFWSQKYCPSHEYDNTARCCSCERLESWNVRYVSLGDGRSLCLECMESSIMDTGDCQPLYHAIRDYYEGMNMKLDQQIPMLLVERQALNEAIVGEKNGFHHMPETRGLCLSEEQTVTSILKRPRVGNHRLVGMRTQHQKLTRKCEVTAILVLYGLPRLLTGAILAHELMHGWLRLKGYRNLNPEVEEGICQVLSYMWLESEIAHDASPAYGGGFRAAYAAVNQYGLRSVLDHIHLTGSFPL
ncbi:Protein DA1-related 2 [Camellia lanceoleosa]|uniref:Protein DA1-related 2 n=1 Tax=Camellia lanceoleosa TaxID=1840588 RepID=A0ACC0ITS1_9ERIC|nr:Protein DA1-related 2 [Camellia lanceoleosa]